MRNVQLDVPTFSAIAAYDADMSPKTLRGIVCDAPGTLFVTDITDTTAKFTILSGTTPFTVIGQIKTVVGDGAGSVGDGVTGTDIALADLVGLK